MASTTNIAEASIEPQASHTVPVDLPALDAVGLQILNQMKDRQQAAARSASMILETFDNEKGKKQRKKFRRWIDAKREAAHERATDDGDLKYVFPAVRTLLAFGASPLKTPPTILDHFELVGKYTEDELSIPAATTSGPDRWILYLRCRVYDGLDELDLLRREVIRYGVAYPAKGPWAKTMLDQVEVYVKSANPVLRLPYAGITIANTALGRISNDLEKEGEVSHFKNFSKVAAEVRRELELPVVSWEILQLRHELVPCSVIALRQRSDLQAAERAVIASFGGYCLKSAPGGFHHLPDFLAYQPDKRSPLLSAPPAPVSAAIKLAIYRHFDDAKRLWSAVPNSGPTISNAAFAVAKEEAVGLRALGGSYTLSLMIGKDIPVSAHQATARDEVGFYGRSVGPGPALSLYLREYIMACGETVTRGTTEWINLVGGFCNFWCLTLIHLLIWLSILILIRYLRLARPLFVRVQSAKVCNLVVSNALGSVVIDSPQARAVMDRFWLCGHTDISALLACITPGWLIRHWKELIPNDWIIWIGRVVIARTGPDPVRDWAIFILLGDDGRVKYDPSLAEDLLHLATIAQAVAVVAEEIIAERAHTHPPPSDDIRPWLEATLLVINAKLQSMKLDSRLDDARESVRVMQAWLGSKRNLSGEQYAAALHQAEAEGHGDQFRAVMRSKALQARALDRENHLFAVGEPNSAERLEQWEAQLAAIAERATRGLTFLDDSLHSRPAGYTDEQAREWWMSRRAGIDMTYATNRRQQTDLAADNYTPEWGMRQFETHLAAWTEANLIPNRWSNTMDIFSAVAELARSPDTVKPNRRLRVLTCIRCNESRIATHNGRHRCGTDGKVTFRDEATNAAVNGVLTRRLVYPHELVEHPLVGMEAWKQAEMLKVEAEEGEHVMGAGEDAADDGDDANAQSDVEDGQEVVAGMSDSENSNEQQSTGGDTTSATDDATEHDDSTEDHDVEDDADLIEAAKLAARWAIVETRWIGGLNAKNVRYIEPDYLEITLWQLHKQYDWFDVELGKTIRTLPIWSPGKSSRHAVLSQVASLYLDARYASLDSDDVLTSDIELGLEDAALWQSRTLESLLQALSASDPIYTVQCNEAIPCSYRGLSVKDVQHKHGNAKPSARKRGRCATSFKQIPIQWQQRVLTHVRFEDYHDAGHIVLRWQVPAV